MSNPGSNGVMDGERNAERFKQWQKEVDDFRPFINQGTLNLSKIADEAGLNRGVCYTNWVIRYELIPALELRLEKQGLLTARMTVPSTVVIQGPRSSGASEAAVKMSQEQNEALKAENSRLRKELQKHQAISQILGETGRLPW